MNFDLPAELQSHLDSIDVFITATILPLQNAPDNTRFFDHRREHTRTDWEQQGNPCAEWERLLSRSRMTQGFIALPFPRSTGGQGHPETNVWMSAIRYHLSSHPVYGGGLGLANDLQNEHSIVGNFPDIMTIHHFGNEQQRQTLIPARLRGEFRTTFGLTEPDHGSDATFMSTAARRDRGGFAITGTKKWQITRPSNFLL
ncbi:hypothetical protein NUU61_009521 [Penicillium alfredii]|uniref:Acyl-CoA dehydrogenase n=1 Tax=Penicillium alfredii TaxID=1506179 RepID=A0A9W9EN71_9EURO|nr:uncharacterized protein NUU61_009521 [Penicillium alfredii]KAJ5084942.1 hypothetical protein NUU61_009521 [Penicillium alfredii]